MKTTVKVFFVDDHQVVLQGLTLRVDVEPDIEICGSATSISSALEEIKQEQPTVVITDISLTGESGLELIEIIRREYPHIHMIVLSMHNEEHYASRCIRAGAKGYVMKSQPLDAVIDAIRTVTSGTLYLSEFVKSQMLLQMNSDGPSSHSVVDTLTKREFEIFQLVGKGMRPRHIAEKLSISAGTVDTHCKNIRSKLMVENMTELIDRASELFENEPNLE